MKWDLDQLNEIQKEEGSGPTQGNRIGSRILKQLNNIQTDEVPDQLNGTE